MAANPVWFEYLTRCLKCGVWMATSVNPDQTAPLGAAWSGFTLFAFRLLH